VEVSDVSNNRSWLCNVLRVTGHRTDCVVMKSKGTEQ